MQRYAQVLKLKPECLDNYKMYHANMWPELAECIRKANIRNYSIYYLQNGYLFAYYEYVGQNYHEDRGWLSEQEINKKWQSLMKPMQEPVEVATPGQWWFPLEELFHFDE